MRRPRFFTVRVPNIATSIETVEVSKKALLAEAGSGGRAPRVRVRPYKADNGFKGSDVVEPQPADLRVMDFSAWRFFHAAKKTSYLNALEPERITRAAAEMLDELKDYFFWRGAIRLVPGATEAWKDADRTGLAARVGEGLGHLLMGWRFQYKYWDHLPSLLRRLSTPGFGRHRESVRRLRARRKSRKLSREPDFVFEKTGGEVALAECKGHLVAADAEPVPIVEPLRDALRQLEGWPPMLKPTPKRTFAINACVVEKGYDVAHEPSFIAFADPEEESPPTDPVDPLEIRDGIRRGNYAGWLMAMGFVQAAHALRWNEPGPGQTHRLRIVSVGNQRVAIVEEPEEVWIVGDPEFTILPFRRRPLLTSGIEISALRRIEGSLRGGLLEDAPDLTSPDDLGKGSLMPDGTWLGFVEAGAGGDTEEEFTL